MTCPYCKKELSSQDILKAGASLMAAKRHEHLTAEQKSALGKKMVEAREAKRKLK